MKYTSLEVSVEGMLAHFSCSISFEVIVRRRILRTSESHRRYLGLKSGDSDGVGSCLGTL